MIGSYIVLVLFAFLVEGVFGDKDEVMSVMEGNHVNLNTDVTKTPDDIFRWYFNGNLIALINGHSNTSCLYDGEGGRFRDRLQVDYKTGSLTITNFRPEHTGRYEAEFIEDESSGKSETSSIIPKCDSTTNHPKRKNVVIKKSFNLTVSASKADKNDEEPQKAPQNQKIDTTVTGSGLSSAAVAGIVVVVVLLVVAAAAAAVGGVMIHRRRSSSNDMNKNNHGLLQKV